MSKLADPTICPDCRASLLPDGTCRGCGLALASPLGVELWQTMLRADALVERLRLASPTGTDTASPAATGSAATGSAISVPKPPSAPSPGRRRLPSASVPMVLLGLGAICLLVSAVVFVAVAWGSLGIGARTLVLAAVTSATAAAATMVTRRGLRWASETLWVVVCGMVALDLLGARDAGLLALDRVTERHAVALLGLLELVVGVAAGVWSAARPTGRLRGPQVVAALGLLLVTTAEAWTSEHAAAATAVAVPLLTASALACRRQLPATALGAALLAALSWAGLVAVGLDRLHDAADDATWWSQLHGWPLLVAAVLAAVAAQAPIAGRGQMQGRFVAATAALACGGLLVVGPLDAPTRALLLGSAVVMTLGLLARVLPTGWARPSALLAALGTTVLAGWLLARPWEILRLLPTDGSADPGQPLPPTVLDRPEWLTLCSPIVVALAVLTAAWGAGAVLPRASRLLVLGGALPAAAPAVTGLALATAMLGTRGPVGVTALVFGVALVATAAVGVRLQGNSRVELVAAVSFAVVAAPAVRLALASDLITALLATILAAAFLAAQRWLRAGLLWEAGTTALAVLGVLFGGLAAVAWVRVAAAASSAEAFAVAGWAVAVGLSAGRLGRDARSRSAVEVAALLLGLGAVALAPSIGAAGLVATVVGSAVCLAAVVQRRSVMVGWLGAGVLAMATLLRLAADVPVPELVSLPGAVLLLGAGTWRLRGDATVTSLRALGSGLSLGLVPSLLLALGDPVSLRGVLVGLAGLVLVAAGIARRWAAPFLAGALTTAVLAVRHLGPATEALPRWVTFGAVGLALLAIGITWEARRRDVQVAARYVAGLR